MERKITEVAGQLGDFGTDVEEMKPGAKIPIDAAVFGFPKVSLDEIAEGKLRIHLSESRNSGTATINISTMYNYGRFYGEYLGMEA